MGKHRKVTIKGYNYLLESSKVTTYNKSTKKKNRALSVRWGAKAANKKFKPMGVIFAPRYRTRGEALSALIERIKQVVKGFYHGE